MQFVPPFLMPVETNGQTRTVGIDGTGMRPGFIKLEFNGKALREVERKLIADPRRSADHRATGLTIGAQTAAAAMARLLRVQHSSHVATSDIDGGLSDCARRWSGTSRVLHRNP